MEQAAWARLLLPLATAMVAGRPGVASVLFVIAAVAAFAAHEPLRVLAGLRGERTRIACRARAVRWLLALAGSSVLAAVVAVALGADDGAGWALVIPVGLTYGHALCVAASRQCRGRGSAGSAILAIAAVVAWSVPAALAASVPFAIASAMLVGWGVAFACGRWAVRRWRAARGLRRRTRGMVSAAFVAPVPFLELRAAKHYLPRCLRSGMRLEVRAAAALQRARCVMCGRVRAGRDGVCGTSS